MIDRSVIENKINECLAKGNKRYGAKAVVSKIVYTRNTKEVGTAVRMPNGEMFIRLSRNYLERVFEWVVDEIIPHEVAHIIGFWLDDNGKDGTYEHDSRWREIAIYLGCSGETKPEIPEEYFTSKEPVTYHYRSSTGRDLHFGQDKHDALQKDYRVFKDTDGGRVTASNYVGK